MTTLEYRLNNKEKIKASRKAYYLKNKERENLNSKLYRERNKDKVKVMRENWLKENTDYHHNYYMENREEELRKAVARNKKYYNEKPERKIRVLYGCRIRRALNGKMKSATTNKLLGCSSEYLKRYLEELFSEGMTWENYGEWHIDHIRPCSSFDLTDPEQQRACFHYTNLQPLWAKDNLKKNNKYIFRM